MVSKPSFVSCSTCACFDNKSETCRRYAPGYALGQPVKYAFSSVDPDAWCCEWNPSLPYHWSHNKFNEGVVKMELTATYEKELQSICLNLVKNGVSIRGVKKAFKKNGNVEKGVLFVNVSQELLFDIQNITGYPLVIYKPDAAGKRVLEVYNVTNAGR